MAELKNKNRNRRAVATQVTENDDLEVISLKDYVRSLGYTQINTKIGVNTNGYPFATFINADNEAENIYFSINAADGLEDSKAINTDEDGNMTIASLKEFAKTYSVAETANADGELRVKLVTSGSTRLDLSDMFED